MREYKNVNPAENDDQIEYVLSNTHNQPRPNEGIYFTTSVILNPISSFKKRPVVVEGTPEGIYELAGENVHGIYDLSSNILNTEIGKKYSMPTKSFSTIFVSAIQIFLGIAVLLIILGVSMSFIGGKGQDTEGTNTTTTAVPSTTELTVGKIIFLKCC